MKNTIKKGVDFAALLRAFEQAPKDPATIYPLAKALSFSVLKKTIDPQRKNAVEIAAAATDPRETVSKSGQSPALIKLRRSIMEDSTNMDSLQAMIDEATQATYTPDGEPITITKDPAAQKAADILAGATWGDGFDLVQTAALALLEQAEAHAAGDGWMERPYSVRRLSRRVYIQTEDSAAWKDEETAPIREAFRAVRREIQNSRAMQTDPRNGYTYLKDMEQDPDSGALETIYRRMSKYADIGGYATKAPVNAAGAPAGMELSGAELYTTTAADIAGYDAIIEALNMTPRQAEIVRLRIQGYGTRAISTKLGVTPAAVKIQLQRLRARCTALGYTPAATVETFAADLVELLFQALNK